MKGKIKVIDNLTKILLYEMYELTKGILINPEECFTKGELNEIKRSVNKDDTEMVIDEIIIHNVEKKIIKSKDCFLCPFISFYDVYNFSTNSLIPYNSKSPIRAKLKINKCVVVNQENINLQSVEDIATLVEKDKLSQIMININVIEPNFDIKSVIYNEENKDLKIKTSFIKGVFADNIEGYHIILGIIKGVIRANTNNKQLEGGVMLMITNYKLEEAQKYIDKENKQNSESQPINILHDGF